VKFGDVDVYTDAVIFGEGDGRLCDAEISGTVGRKFGEVAKESARFDGAVANNALKSGEVEPVVVIVTSSDATLGHTASAPSST
jgi:hypothetical protein